MCAVSLAAVSPARASEVQSPNVRLCRGRFHNMRLDGRAVLSGTIKRGCPTATLDGYRHQPSLGGHSSRARHTLSFANPSGRGAPSAIPDGVIAVPTPKPETRLPTKRFVPTTIAFA